MKHWIATKLRAIAQWLYPKPPQPPFPPRPVSPDRDVAFGLLTQLIGMEAHLQGYIAGVNGIPLEKCSEIPYFTAFWSREGNEMQIPSKLNSVSRQIQIHNLIQSLTPKL